MRGGCLCNRKHCLEPACDMKNIFLLFFLILLFNACKKSGGSGSSAQLTFSDIIGKRLIMDSGITILNGIPYTTVAGPGVEDMQFDANGTYTIYVNPPIVKDYLLKGKDTVYYWTPPQTMNPEQYLIIRSIINKHMISDQNENSVNLKKITYYQHFE